MTTQQHQLPVEQPNLLGPAFTKKEEDAELATLTIDDVLEIEKDLRGVTAGMGNMTMAKGAMIASEAPLTKKRRSCESDSVTENEPVVVANADLYRLEEELLRIPLMKKQRYVEATLKCPQQVNAFLCQLSIMQRTDLFKDIHVVTSENNTILRSNYNCIIFQSFKLPSTHAVLEDSFQHSHKAPSQGSFPKPKQCPNGARYPPKCAIWRRRHSKDTR